MLQGGHSERYQQAQDARHSATAKLQALQNGPTGDILQADQSAVASDKAALASAQAANAALGGANAANLQNAQSQVDSMQAQLTTAQAQLDSANAALTNLTGSSASDLQARRAPTIRRPRNCSPHKRRFNRTCTRRRQRSLRLNRRSRKLNPN